MANNSGNTIKGITFGWEMIMDLYDCDHGSISDEISYPIPLCSPSIITLFVNLGLKAETLSFSILYTQTK